MPDTRIRCFIAISLPDGVKQGLKRVQADLKRPNFHSGWPSPSRFHLTLAFLGDIPVKKIGPIKKAMQTAALESNGFELVINRLGVFPGIKKARIIWAGLNRESKDLQALYQNLYTKLNTAGLFFTKQRFFPHITLARLNKRSHPAILKRILKEDVFTEPAKFQVKHMDLYKSQLIRSGAIHTKLYTANLEKI